MKTLLQDMAGWTDAGKYVLAQPGSNPNHIEIADFVGSTSEMLQWVNEFPYDIGTIWVVTTDEASVNDMRLARPTLDIILAHNI